MLGFLLRRLLALVPVLALVLVIAFALVRIVPGDAATSLLGPGATNAQIEALRAQLRLDQPILLQFTTYVGGVLTGDLGLSSKTGAPVLTEILARLPATLELAILATLVAVAVGVPVGIVSALRPDSLLDHAVRVLSLAGISTPVFLLALVLQVIFGATLGWLPISGRLSPYATVPPVTGFAVLDGLVAGDAGAAWSALQHLVLPTLVLSAFLAATLGRFVRNAMLDTMGEDFIRTARAKGVVPPRIVMVHGLRNSLLPTVTIIGLKFAEMLSGAILTETIFAWPGIGRYLFEGIKNRDYPVIQGTTLVFALLYVLSSLVADFLQGVLDPRLRARMS